MPTIAVQSDPVGGSRRKRKPGEQPRVETKPMEARPQVTSLQAPPQPQATSVSSPRDAIMAALTQLSSNPLPAPTPAVDPASAIGTFNTGLEAVTPQPANMQVTPFVPQANSASLGGTSPIGLGVQALSGATTDTNGNINFAPSSYMMGSRIPMVPGASKGPLVGGQSPAVVPPPMQADPMMMQKMFQRFGLM
jgi:hypothetical protein